MFWNTAHWPQLLKVFPVAIILHCHIVSASKIRRLKFGSKIQGTTVGEPNLIKVDNYKGGQALVEVLFSEENIHELRSHNGVVSITTCSAVTNYDTKLYAFNSNPLTDPTSSAKWTHRNDNDCGLQSTIQMTASLMLPFFILVTGYRGTEGVYEIRAVAVLKEAISIPWGLDRIDQRLLPLDGVFSIKEAGQGVSIYILDSGVRASHSEFLQKDGSSRVSFGNDFVERLDTIVDETGHGTHVAALAAGQSFGVAKKAAIVSVRVLDRTNAGFISQLVEALEWARNDVLARKALPSVVVLSLSTAVSTVLNHAVARLTSAGVAVVTAAGNDATNSCFVSPASEASALSVGAIDMTDQISPMSNWGNCVSIYAPGEEILSAWHTGDKAEQKLSGTSSACPFVAGAVAVLLEQNPSLRPEEIKEVIKATATSSVRDETTRQNGKTQDELSPKTKSLKMLYVRSIPVILRDGSPSQGKMYMYAIFGLVPPSDRLQACHVSNDIKDKVKDVLISTLGEVFKDSIYMKLCCEGHLNAGCDEGNVFHGTRLIVRLSTREAQAYSTFETLTKFCRGKKADVRLGNQLGIDVFVAAQPWVVDSRGYKYWAAPALSRTLSRGITTFQLVLITCSTALLIIISGCVLFALFQRSRRRKQQRNQDYFDERAAEYEMGKVRHMDLGSLDDIVKPPQFLTEMRRVNSELQDDILETISPSGVLPTPISNKPGLNTGVKGQVPEDRPRNQGFEKMQTSTSFFTRLWTPRTARTSSAETSFRGKNPFRLLPRILSFGPERGAVVDTASPLPLESSNTYRTSGGRNGPATTSGDALRKLDCPEEHEK